jgi:hypothetical protein
MNLSRLNLVHSSLHGVMVSVLAIGPKVRGFIFRRGNRFLRAIKLCSTTSFGGGVKQSAPCCKMLLSGNSLVICLSRIRQ